MTISLCVFIESLFRTLVWLYWTTWCLFFCRYMRAFINY